MSKVNRVIAYLCLHTTQEGTAGYVHVNEIIAGLRDAGWSVTLFEPQYPSETPRPGILRRLYEFLRVQVKFLCTRRMRWDAIYVRSHFALFPAAALAKWARIPVIQEVNGPYEELFAVWPISRYFKSLVIWLIKKQYQMADAIIAVTPDLKQWVIKETNIDPGRIKVIPNGANTRIFRPMEVSQTRCRTPYAVFFGALSPWQGIDTMLDAVKLNGWPPKLNLVIIGDGVDRQQVETAIDDGAGIQYLGQLPHRQLAEIVSNAMIGLIPKSGRCGHLATGLFPLKLFEMVACGIPVIVSEFPGQADFVRQYQCGEIIAPDDSHALVKAINRLYDNPEMRKKMGARGRKAVVSEHSWAKRAEATKHVIEKRILQAISK